MKFKYLDGPFQKDNAKIAISTINTFKKYNLLKIKNNDIKKGLQDTKWPGRLEFLQRNVLVDCAHNISGIKTLINELKIIKKNRKFRNIIFIFAVLKDKDIKEMLKNIIKLKPSRIIFTQPQSNRVFSINQLTNLFKKINKNKKIIHKEIKNPKQALKYAKKISGKNDLVVVTGSLYLVGEII